MVKVGTDKQIFAGTVSNTQNSVQSPILQYFAGKTIAIDGKTICSTDKLTPDGNPLHIASAIVSDLGLVIGSQECGTKIGEMTAFRELIDMLDIAGAVVVTDALHYHKKSAEKVVKAGGTQAGLTTSFVKTVSHPLIAAFVSAG